MTNSTNVKHKLVTKREIGLRIYQAIEKSGWPREEVAARLYVSLRTINYWQSGTKSPSIVKLCELCELFNVSLDSLLRN